MEEEDDSYRQVPCADWGEDEKRDDDDVVSIL